MKLLPRAKTLVMADLLTPFRMFSSARAMPNKKVKFFSLL